MEISGKVLREVEFRDRLRGYDTDEVDEFLEKVAVAVDEMHSELARLGNRSQSPSQSHVRPLDEVPQFDDDSIRRTLVLAQRTADLAVSEAREESERMLSEARQQSETIVSQAQDAVRRMRSEAEQEVHERVGRLEAERERLEREIGTLVGLLESERERLTTGLGAALRFVEETLAVPPEVARVESRRANPPLAGNPPAGESAEAAEQESPRAPSPWNHSGERSPGGEPTVATPMVVGIPDVEAEISEDAATAARREPQQPTSGTTAGPIGLSQTSPPPALDADEALWAQWASGTLDSAPGTGSGPRDTVGSDAPLRFDRRPGGGRSA